VTSRSAVGTIVLTVAVTLDRRILSPHVEALAFIGILEPGPGLFAIVERQAVWLGEVLARRLGVPRRTLSAARQKEAPAPWLRQVGRRRAILIYRDLPPAVVRAPG
jgi:hypothetical protein